MAKIKVSGELEVATAEGKLADASQVVDSTLQKTQEEINAQVSESLANKADRESYVQIKVTGTAIAHYAKATDIPLATAASGHYLCDLASGGVTRRVITIVAGGAIVNEISPANGDTYICTSEGKLYAAAANNTSSWTECGAIGVQGEQGYGMVATVSRDAFTEAQWATYGTLNRNEEWSGTSRARNGCRIGDLFTVSGTSTDGGRAHFLLFRSTTATGNLIGTCIGHTTAERGKAATVKVGTVTTGEAGSDAEVTNSGTAEDVVLDFKIPKGKQGESAINVVQEIGTSTADVMSQDAATKNFAIGKDIGQPTCVYLSAVNSIELSDKQVELLEARDVISVEICVSNLNRNNNYNKTIAPQYFSITLGDKSLGSNIKCRYDGVPNYRGCGVTNRPFNWENLAHGITIPCGYDRWIMVLDRKKGRIALYDRPGSLIQEETDETLFKSDSWFGGVKSLGFYADFANLFGLRIYDHDISVIHKAYNQFSEQEVFGENLLPYHYPRYYNESINRQDIIYDKDHWLINSVSKYPRPYRFGVLSKMYKDDEGLHMISDKEYASNDATTVFACATYAEPTYDLSTKSVFIATFRVVTGSVRPNTNDNGIVSYLVGSGITDTDGNVYTTSDILGPGTYTMEFMASTFSTFCIAAEANTEIVLIKTEIYLPRLVISLDFHTVFKNKVYDAVWDKWYESKATDGYPTNVVPWKFSNEKYDALSPNTLSKPGRRGDMKIDTNGDVYIGVVNGPTQVWKKINNA